MRLRLFGTKSCWRSVKPTTINYNNILKGSSLPVASNGSRWAGGIIKCLSCLPCCLSRTDAVKVARHLPVLKSIVRATPCCIRWRHRDIVRAEPLNMHALLKRCPINKPCLPVRPLAVTSSHCLSWRWWARLEVDLPLTLLEGTKINTTNNNPSSI